ncbi:MAG: 16S rRNA (cytidine(1402)-2'-O)-methyltransferase [Rhodospirillales bacterium]|nr:16S rRNA (cytidine(1402)-2'-O)-methyltransferase [Rhodospirillales bacterium]
MSSISQGEPSRDGKTSKLPAGIYVVATPLGNLGDITRRAQEILAAADIVACEDTRVTRRLLAALGIPARRLMRYDDHAAGRTQPALIEAVQHGGSVALVSDAGTPLIADPGYKLIRAAREAGLAVTAVPGPSAAMAALSVSGLPSDRFLFLGFLPQKAKARAAALAEVKAVRATLIVFESPRRLPESLAAMADIFGPREAVVARELTKLFEETRRGSLAELAAAYAESGPPRGEVVVIIGPPAEITVAEADAAPDLDVRLTAALGGMSLRDAVADVARATGRPRREVYARALALGIARK